MFGNGAGKGAALVSWCGRAGSMLLCWVAQGGGGGDGGLMRAAAGG